MTSARVRTKRGVASNAVGRSEKRVTNEPPAAAHSNANRQPKKLKPTSPRKPVQLGLGFDDKQDALAVLQQENKRLLSRIAQRRASLALLRRLSEQLMQEASQRVLPYREELKALTRELLDLESRVLGAESLVGRKRDQVRLAFHELLKGLPQDELENEQDEASEPLSGTASNARDGAEHATERAAPNATRGANDAPKDEAATHEAGLGAANPATPGANNDEVEPASRPTRAQSEAAQPEARSADKPAGDQAGALRSLFKRLVIQWHPDRVRDDAQKAERTKLMKEFTAAFEGGDLAKLVALEQTLALRNQTPQTSTETPEKRAEQLRRANTELVKQLAELRVSLEAVKEDCPFTLDYRKKDPAKAARDELDEFVLMNHLEVQRATETRDFVLSFAQGKMKLADFLQAVRR